MSAKQTALIVLLGIFVLFIFNTFFSVHETASSSEFCWLTLVMRIPMLSGSFCKWGLLVLVVFNRLVMLSLLVGLFLLVSCHLFLLMMLASGVDAGSAGVFCW
mgnify:CR=1 FL=1